MHRLSKVGGLARAWSVSQATTMSHIQCCSGMDCGLRSIPTKESIRTQSGRSSKTALPCFPFFFGIHLRHCKCKREKREDKLGRWSGRSRVSSHESQVTSSQFSALARSLLIDRQKFHFCFRQIKENHREQR